MPGLTGDILDAELTDALNLGVTLEDLPFDGIYTSTTGPTLSTGLALLARVLKRLQSRFIEEIRFRQRQNLFVLRPPELVQPGHWHTADDTGCELLASFVVEEHHTRPVLSRIRVLDLVVHLRLEVRSVVVLHDCYLHIGARAG